MATVAPTPPAPHSLIALGSYTFCSVCGSYKPADLAAACPGVAYAGSNAGLVTGITPNAYALWNSSAPPTPPPFPDPADWSDLDADEEGTEPGRRRFYELCVDCEREMSPTLDAYYGRNPMLRDRCIDCRTKRVRESGWGDD
jgi:hypothetical protein